MALFDEHDPDQRPVPKTLNIPKGRGDFPQAQRRGDFTTPEKREGIAELKEAIARGDDYALRRSMALSLYRLGAEPLNKLAGQLLALLEGQV